MYVTTGIETPTPPPPAPSSSSAASPIGHAHIDAGLDAATKTVFLNNRKEALKSFCSDGEIEDEEVVSLIPSFKECVEQIFPAVKNESNESLEVLPSFEGGEKTVNLR